MSIWTGVVPYVWLVEVLVTQIKLDQAINILLGADQGIKTNSELANKSIHLREY